MKEYAKIMDMFSEEVEPNLVKPQAKLKAKKLNFGLSEDWKYSMSFMALEMHWMGEMDKNSSNFRELWNLMDAIEMEGSAGRLKREKLFIITDNLVSEGTFYKDNLF
eukprot:1263787-Ditylum_brightwellii.AAC.1